MLWHLVGSTHPYPENTAAWKHKKATILLNLHGVRRLFCGLMDIFMI
jgi:hypothetical protein